MPECIFVNTRSHSYPIYIGEGLLAQSQYLIQHIVGQQVMIVTNQTLAGLYLQELQSRLAALQCDVVILPDGEQYKTLATLDGVFSQLISKQHGRNTTLLALGGGVIGDITGFAAACYMRGVNYLQLPTSLLAQVDAAIGGKTAVNHISAKNLIGAFHQPSAVLIDPLTLATLPEREYCAGLAEVIKYGLMADGEFFIWLEKHLAKIKDRDPQTLHYILQRCCQLKAQIVSEDEYDRGKRMLLNLGHTFAHAIETHFNYQTYLHGEAVAIGLCIATIISQQFNGLKEDTFPRVRTLLSELGLPTRLPSSLTIKQLLSLMTHDKKASLADFNLILLKNIGSAYFAQNIAYDWLDNFLATCREIGGI